MNLNNIVKGWSKHLLNEFGFTEPPEYAVKRLEQCSKCEFAVSNPFNDSEKDKSFCGVCKCYNPAKVLVKNEKCPKELWQ